MYIKTHICVDCGVAFEAHSSRAVRCQKCREIHKAGYQKEYIEAHPELSEYNRKYLRVYNKREDVKERARLRAQTEDVKKQGREYKRQLRATPEGLAASRAIAKKYENSDKGRATRKAYSQSEKRREVYASYRHRRRAQQLGALSNVWTRDEIIKRDKGVCQICGLPVYDYKNAPQRLKPQLDHVVPLSRGGANVKSNIQLAHAYCNNHKNTGEADVELCRSVIGEELCKLADSVL